jgi:hypothetical protein
MIASQRASILVVLGNCQCVVDIKKYVEIGCPILKVQLEDSKVVKESSSTRNISSGYEDQSLTNGDPCVELIENGHFAISSYN